MLPMATYRIHLDQLERYDAPPEIECCGLRPVGGTPVELLSIAGMCSIFGTPAHLRRIRDVVNARLAEIEVETIVAELQEQDEAPEAALAALAG